MKEHFYKEEQTYTSQQFDKRAKINPAIGDMLGEEFKLISRDNFQTLSNHNLILH